MLTRKNADNEDTERERQPESPVELLQVQSI
jgi:hypothetical protein